MDIQMVDLYAQYLTIKEEIDAGIEETIRSTRFINGDATKEFAKELASFLQVEKVIPCGNGTDALQIALMGLELQPGDEVITPTFTFIATVEVIALLGLKPVLVDVSPDTFMMDVRQVERAITPKTKAIIPVHLFGQTAPMKELLALSEATNIPIIEDAAQATGSDYRFDDGQQKKAGSMGLLGTTSFFPSKNLGAFGDGGAVFTQDKELGERIQMIINHGAKKKYYHDIIGVNSRLDTLQAAILRVKLKYLDRFNGERLQKAAYYDAALKQLPNITIPYRSEQSTHIFHQYTLKIGEGQRDYVKTKLAEKGIPSMVYYPLPLHQQKAFQKYISEKTSFPIAEKLCREVLSLPMHSELTVTQQDYIIEQLENI